jgi:hypothetical protein
MSTLTFVATAVVVAFIVYTIYSSIQAGLARTSELKAYLLRGQDETALRQIFTDRVLRFFRENQGWMVEGDGKRLLLNRLNADEVRTYWRGAVAPGDAGEIGAMVSAVRAGNLGEKLKASPGLPLAELRSFLRAALDAAGQFRTS